MAEGQQNQTGGGGGQTPAFDFTKMLQQFQIPGVDFSSIIERERKNNEALAEANRIAFEGWQNLVRRQGEILQDSMKRAVDDAKNQTALKNGAELARSAFETALGTMRELAELVLQKILQLFEAERRRAGFQLDEGLWRLPAIFITDADHADFFDGGVLVDRLLDDARIDVEAAAKQHVLGAVDNIDVAVLI